MLPCLTHLSNKFVLRNPTCQHYLSPRGHLALLHSSATQAEPYTFKRWRIRPETETGDKINVRGIPEYRMEFGQNYLVLTLGGYKKKDVPIFL